MNRPIVRISSIEINNFKNVIKGKINTGIDNNLSSNIIGIYGQNGSGKTALINALSLLKFILCGQSVPSDYCNYINTDSDCAFFAYEFLIKLNDAESVKAKYSFSIKKEKRTKANNVFLKTKNGQLIKTNDNQVLKASSNNSFYKAIVQDENLSYITINGEKNERCKCIISTPGTDVFLPKSKYDLLIGKDDNVRADLIVAKKICLSESRSFAFSAELLSNINNNASTDPLKDLMLSIIESLVIFGNHELFVIDTSNHALISLDALPVSFRYDDDKRCSIGSIALPLNKSAVIPESEVSLVENIISNMNIVLKTIIPDLTISVRILGTELIEDGINGKVIELVSHKNSEEIPLKYESEGIKKIISILQLLIVVFNQSSITVAIDELDSGIFEYLLGELLQILNEKGKGQVIFTSHNLRPLETLDKKSIYFTTINPNNRYIKMINLKPNNNLRDFYYRSIILGGQHEELYQPTDNFAIAMAFRRAGKNG